MARPRTPIGAHGVVHTQRVGTAWRARTLYRFQDGKRRQVERTGSTAAKATAALKRALVEIETPMSEGVTRATSLSALAALYLDLTVEAGLKPRSVETCRHNIRKIILPMIGDLTVGELTTLRTQRFLTQVAKVNGPGSAKGCRSALSGMMALAVSSDALPYNPVAGVERIRKGPSRAAEALPADRISEFRAAVRGDAEMRRLDLVDLWEFMLHTGSRIGEATALTWDRVDLDAGKVALGPNVVRIIGEGLRIQGQGKSMASMRTISMSEGLTQMLRARRSTVIETPEGLVFPSVLGKLRDPSNTEANWRANRDRLGFPGFKSHGFRKTVATVLDQAGLSAREIAEFLGHENPSLTQDVYMSRTAGTVRAAAALDSLLPRATAA